MKKVITILAAIVLIALASTAEAGRFRRCGPASCRASVCGPTIYQPVQAGELWIGAAYGPVHGIPANAIPAHLTPTYWSPRAGCFGGACYR